MKVKADEVEDGEAYEYFTGEDENGDPIWVKGSDGAAQAKVIINEPVGEIYRYLTTSILGNFIMTYLHEEKRHCDARGRDSVGRMEPRIRVGQRWSDMPRCTADSCLRSTSRKTERSSTLR